jgi:hypothetical protein
MSLRITIDVFSGRPNPVVEVSGRQAKEVLERIKPEGALSKREVDFLTRPHLGYRGLIFEQIGDQTRSLPRTFRVVRGTMLGPDGARRTAGEELEDFLFRRSGPLGKVKVAPGFQRFLAREVVRFHRAKFKFPRQVHKPPRCLCAPDYERWRPKAIRKQLLQLLHQLPHRHVCATRPGRRRDVHGAYLRLSATSGHRRRLNCQAGRQKSLPGGRTLGRPRDRSWLGLSLVPQG